jgi:palmitoyltransferase
MLLKQLIPREKADKFGVGATLFLIALVCINGLLKLNTLFHSSPSYTLLILFLALYTLFNVLGNMYKAITTDTTIMSIRHAPTTLLVDWRYCSHCELNAPPRAQHCFTCKKCVLKRHNHCLFLGKCAGHKNVRFYLLFIFHVWCACLLSNTLNTDFFLELIANFSLTTLLILFVPWLACLLGLVGVSEIFLVFANSLCLILGPLMTLYFYINFSMALRGETWHERAKQITSYRLGWRENFLQVFGSNWLLAIFCPFVESELPSDGTIFRNNLRGEDTATAEKPNGLNYSYINPNFEDQGERLNLMMHRK